MVEFALALPILLLVLYGLLETGRLIFIYASVVTGARQGARYGSASGDTGSGSSTPYYYQDCNGIRAAARKVAFIQPFSSIDIQYDKGPENPANIAGGCPISALSDNDHRIKVTVSAVFTPIVPLVPFKPFTITSTSNRTILTGVSIAVDQSIATLSAGGGGLLTLGKSANPNTYSAAGQVITYTFHLTNPTSNTIANIILSDPMFPGLSCGPFNLAGGASHDCSATYTTTQADVDGGQPIVNNAQATGLDTLSGTAITATSTATVTFIANPALTLVKAGVAPTLIAQGQFIQYTFTLQNTGNVTLTSPFTIVDSIASNLSCPTGSLAVNATMTCTGRYALKNADINAGFVNNTATATGKYNATTVTSNSSTFKTIVPELKLILSANVATISGLPTTITFTYQLTNSTSLNLSNIKVSDNHGASSYACLASLASGATSSCTRTYVVTQADIDAGVVFTNTASATSQGGHNSNQSGVTITVVQTPAITLTKSANPSAPASGTTFTLPTTITYSYFLKNTGNVTLVAPFGITDNKLGVVCSIASGTLAPGATLGSPSPTCTKTYALQPADLNAGSVINKAKATGTFSAATITSPDATATVITYTLPRMALTKTADVGFFTGVGNPINYTYTFTNTGGVPITLNAPYTLTDNILGSFNCGSNPITLPLGGSAGCKTILYNVKPIDVTNKKVTNTVSVTGGTSTPAYSPASPAPVTVPLFQCDATTVLGSGAIANGGDVTWTVTNNSGLAIHIQSMYVYWTNPTEILTQVFLNGLSIWTGSGNSGGSVNGGPWTLNTAANTIRLLFNPASPGATSPRVVLGFQETACQNFFLYSSP